MLCVFLANSKKSSNRKQLPANSISPSTITLSLNTLQPIYSLIHPHSLSSKATAISSSITHLPIFNFSCNLFRWARICFWLVDSPPRAKAESLLNPKLSYTTISAAHKLSISFRYNKLLEIFLDFLGLQKWKVSFFLAKGILRPEGYYVQAQRKMNWFCEKVEILQFARNRRKRACAFRVFFPGKINDLTIDWLPIGLVSSRMK